MFDPNKFKRSVKEWVKKNSSGSLDDFVCFCEEQIPPAHFTANRWLIDQSVSWYKYVLKKKEEEKAECE